LRTCRVQLINEGVFVTYELDEFELDVLNNPRAIDFTKFW